MLLERAGRWKSTGLRGVRFRTLHADRRANRRTIVLKMDPGSELPDHDHAGVEEVYMVSGDLAVGDTVLGPGDYFRAAAGAKHGIPRTTSGCVCIVISDYVPFPAVSWVGFAWTALRGLFRRSPRM
jgi:anti-sigma factor ChrR (cupin superfamily)